MQRLKRLEALGERLKDEFLQKNSTGEVLIEEKNGDCFEGYTENYIKCFVKGDLNVGDVVEVELFKPFKNGVLAKIK